MHKDAHRGGGSIKQDPLETLNPKMGDSPWNFLQHNGPLTKIVLTHHPGFLTFMKRYMVMLQFRHNTIKNIKYVSRPIFIIKIFRIKIKYKMCIVHYLIILVKQKMF